MSALSLHIEFIVSIVVKNDVDPFSAARALVTLSFSLRDWAAGFLIRQIWINNDFASLLRDRLNLTND